MSRERLERSGISRHARELVLHGVEWAEGDRLVGFALSEGSMQTLLEAGVSEEDVGLDVLRLAANAMPEAVHWWIGYRACIGLRKEPPSCPSVLSLEPCRSGHGCGRLAATTPDALSP